MCTHIHTHVSQPPPPETESTPAAAAADEEVKKPTRLAIGVEGGFDGGVQKKEYEQTLCVVGLPNMTSVPWPWDQAPPQVSLDDLCTLVMGPGPTPG